MNGLTCYIYENKRFGNCSNGGLSAYAKTVLLVDVENAPDTDRGGACVRLDHNFNGVKGNLCAVPVTETIPVGVKAKGCGPMFGGSFIYSSDARFPSKTPIKLMDRFE